MEKIRGPVAFIQDFFLYVSASSNSWVPILVFNVRKQRLVALNLQRKDAQLDRLRRIIQIVGGHMFAKVSALVAESSFGETYG